MPAIDLFQRSDEVKIEALKGYGRTLENVKQDVESIKEWAKKQPHLPEIPNDVRIEAFLIAAKFEFSKAKKMIDMYYTVRGVIPEFFRDPEAPEMLNIQETLYWVPLPKLAAPNCRVILCKLRKRSSNDSYNPEAMMAYISNLIEIVLIEDAASFKTFIIDVSNVQIEHVTAMTPVTLKKALYISEEVFSNRINQMHFFNVAPAVEPFITFIKSFMKAKLVERLHFHKNFDAIFEHIPKEVIPRDYGGEEESLDTLQELWKNKIKEYIPILRKQNLLKTDESKRLGECSFNPEYLGLEGNFRKLNVD